MCYLFLCSTIAPSCAQIIYPGPGLTVPPSATNNGDVVPNFFCDDNVGNCFDVDLPRMPDDNNVNNGIIGPFAASECTTLEATFVFSSSGNLDNGDDVFLCYRLNNSTAYFLADNNNAINNSDADTDCGALADNNDLDATNYNENATIGGVDNCDDDWENVAVDVLIYGGPITLTPNTSFQFRACTDFDDPNEEVTLDYFIIFGDNCAFDIVLPVELVDIQARPKADHIQLSWTTATEIDFSHYEIEHSTNGKQFALLHKTKTQEENGSLSALFYAWMHHHPAKGSNYYRLKMVDLDGTFEYSPIVHSTWHEKDDLQVFPNPVTSTFRVKGGVQDLQLLNINGQVVKNWQRAVSGIDYDIQNLPSGIYQLVNTENRQSVRVVKQ